MKLKDLMNWENVWENKLMLLTLRKYYNSHRKTNLLFCFGVFSLFTTELLTSVTPPVRSPLRRAGPGSSAAGRPRRQAQRAGPEPACRRGPAGPLGVCGARPVRRDCGAAVRAGRRALRLRRAEAECGGSTTSRSTERQSRTLFRAGCSQLPIP